MLQIHNVTFNGLYLSVYTEVGQINAPIFPLRGDSPKLLMFLPLNRNSPAEPVQGQPVRLVPRDDRLLKFRGEVNQMQNFGYIGDVELELVSQLSYRGNFAGFDKLQCDSINPLLLLPFHRNPPAEPV